MGINWAWAADRLHRLIRNHPYAIGGAALCLAVLSLTYTRGHLEFWTERNVLISQKSPSAILYGEYRKEFKDDYVILVLRSKDLEQAKRFASDLGKRMEADRETIQEVFYRIPMETFRRQNAQLVEAIETFRRRVRVPGPPGGSPRRSGCGRSQPSAGACPTRSRASAAHSRRRP